MRSWPRRPGHQPLGVIETAGWFALLGVVTATLVPMRTVVNEAHVVLAYLLVVQLGSARGGRPLGVALAAAAFLCFDWFLLPPYDTLIVQNPLDWLVLLAFLLTSVVSAQLLYRAQAEAENARQRAVEFDRLASLGAETLNVGRAEVALTSIVEVIRSTCGADDCAVFTVSGSADAPAAAGRAGAAEAGSPVRGTHVILLARASTGTDGGSSQAPRLVEWVATHGEPAAERTDGTATLGLNLMATDDGAVERGELRLLLRPLRVRERTVGVLSVRRGSGLMMDGARLRVLDALAYYAALGVERVRLVADAERATALQEAHRAKDAVLASVSHDLRTPLTTIKGLAHELAEGGDERAQHIEEEADRLNRMVVDLLDLSRINSGAVVLDIQPNEAEDLVGAAAQRARGLLGARELRLTLTPSDELLFGRFDFSSTLRALVNLVENAAKYSPAATPIDLTVSRDGEWLRFDVADRGPGIPEGERDRVFEPFYGRAVAGGAPSGAGLGLSIARSLTTAQKGSLTYSDRAGGGSVFTIRVPAVDIRPMRATPGGRLDGAR